MSTRIPALVVAVQTVNPGVQTPCEWRTRSKPNAPSHGQPNAENLKAWVARFEASTQPGGPNAHLGAQKVASAFIRDQRSGEIVATYGVAS